MMTNQPEQSPRIRRGTGLKMTLSMLCYLCVLVVAIKVDGVVEAQAQYRELSTQAETVRQENLVVLDTARSDALQVAQQNALQLAQQQQVAQEARDEEARLAAEAAAKAGTTPKSTSGTAGAPTTPVQPAATASFNAAAYGGWSGTSKVDYWKGVNSDTIGYLYIPGSNISHAVLQNTSSVNYYLQLGYDKNYSYNGVLWTNPNTSSAGSSADMSSNTVIYGHNWTNYSANPRVGGGGDVMFAQLTGYHHLSRAKSYPYFYYATSSETMTFKIFACFYTEPSFNYIQTEGNTQYIIDEALRRSRHSFDTDVSGSDKIITLSTCTRAYGATDNQRFVVMGRLLRPGESATEVAVASNPNHKQPNVW